MTNEMQPLRRAIEQALSQFGYEYGAMQGSIVFEIVTEKAAHWRSQALIYENERFVEVNVYVTDDQFPVSRSWWVAELAARMTDTVPAANFIFRYDVLDVRLRVVRAFGTEEITATAIKELIEIVAFPLTLWKRAFDYRYKASIAPQMALEAALIGEKAYSGLGLSKSARKAILNAGIATPSAQNLASKCSEPACLTLMRLV